MEGGCAAGGWAAAEGGDVKALASTVLRLCDVVRDEKLPYAGVRLEDRSGGAAVWKLANKDELLEEIEKKKQEKIKKEEQKRLRLEEDVRKTKELTEKAKISPGDMFLDMKDKYSKFDDNVSDRCVFR